MADENLSTEPVESTESRSLASSLLAPRYLLGVLGIVAFAAVPFLGISTTQLLVLIGAFYFGMFAMSWDAVSGYTGEISFGHALFFAVGGYTSTLLNLGFGLPPTVTIPAGVLLAAVAGLLIGVPALRIRGPYLSLVTLVAPLILLQVFIIYGGIFGGELGLSSPAALVTADEFDLVVTANYYIAFGLFLAILLLLFAITRSDIGSVLTAIREDEDAVAAAGLNVAKFKVFAFVLSAAIGGLAGAMFVHTPVGSPRPSQLLALIVSIEVLIAAILGGMGTIVGAGLGGVFFYFVNDLLNQQNWAIPVVGVGINEASLLIFALLTMALIYVLPQGVFPSAIRAGRRLLGRARSDPVATDGGHEPDGTTNPLEQATDRYRRALEDLEERIRGDDR
jgi:branched-chain amino acid transport system permease protein